MIPLACPVRNCHLPLGRAATAWRCDRAHSFDIARSGYVNLLQPQDRRSPDAGDPRAALEARSRLLGAGIGARILDAFVTRAVAVLHGDRDVVVDLGCGVGDAIVRLSRRRHVTAIGIDLAVHAVDVAARRVPSSTWVVANADRRLPLLDVSVSVVLSLHARRNPDQVSRVLMPGGYLVVAVPAPDDLVELRETVQGRRVERDRAEAVITEHQRWFDLVDQSREHERHQLTNGQLRDLLQGTYRGERSSLAERVRSLADLSVTLASDFLVLRRR